MTPAEEERRRRMRLTIAAYAYEFHPDKAPIMSDGEYDKESMLVDTSIDTGNAKWDQFFRDHFDKFTGQWIHQHPDHARLKKIYYSILRGKAEAAKRKCKTTNT